MTLGFILVPAGAVRPAVACLGHYIVLHRGTRRGGLQAWRERRPGLQVLEVLIEASANIVVKAERVHDCYLSSYLPLRLGDVPSFYRPRKEQFTGVSHYSPTCGGVASSATELATVLANLALVGTSWRFLCSYRSGFEGGGVEVGCPVVARGPARQCHQRGSVRGTVEGMTTSRPRALQQRRGCRCSTRRGTAVGRWPHRADSDGEDRSGGLTSRHSPV
jgi:hypothetical protein